MSVCRRCGRWMSQQNLQRFRDGGCLTKVRYDARCDILPSHRSTGESGRAQAQRQDPCTFPRVGGVSQARTGSDRAVTSGERGRGGGRPARVAQTSPAARLLLGGTRIQATRHTGRDVTTQTTTPPATTWAYSQQHGNRKAPARRDERGCEGMCDEVSTT